jgi:DNA-binding NarL/FixJ family response regulator
LVHAREITGLNGFVDVFAGFFEDAAVNPIDVIVAEDDFFTREGISRLLERAPETHLVGQASGGEEAVAQVLAKRPQVLLLDIHMPPGIDGIEVIKRLRAAGSDTWIIVLTEDMGMIRTCQARGANGYIPKEKHAIIIDTVRCVAQTGTNMFINPDVSRDYMALLSLLERAGLTQLEREVWRLIGYKNGEIAKRLCKAPGRIRNVVAELYFKLEIADNDRLGQRMQAYRLAQLLGIAEEPGTEPVVE